MVYMLIICADNIHLSNFENQILIGICFHLHLFFSFEISVFEIEYQTFEVILWICVHLE